MGIPDQENRLAAMRALLFKFAKGEATMPEVLKAWWIRKRPDGIPCQRCVDLHCAFRGKRQ
jgi:hypothetical protein